MNNVKRVHYINLVNVLDVENDDDNDGDVREMNQEGIFAQREGLSTECTVLDRAVLKNVIVTP